MTPITILISTEVSRHDEIRFQAVAVNIIEERIRLMFTKVGINAADCQIHLCHLPRVSVGFLSVNGNYAAHIAVCLNEFRTLHEHPATATAGVVYPAVGKGTKHRNEVFTMLAGV